MPGSPWRQGNIGTRAPAVPWWIEQLGPRGSLMKWPTIRQDCEARQIDRSQGDGRTYIPGPPVGAAPHRRHGALDPGDMAYLRNLDSPAAPAPRDRGLNAIARPSRLAACETRRSRRSRRHEDHGPLASGDQGARVIEGRQEHWIQGARGNLAGWRSSAPMSSMRSVDQGRWAQWHEAPHVPGYRHCHGNLVYWDDGPSRGPGGIHEPAASSARGRLRAGQGGRCRASGIPVRPESAAPRGASGRPTARGAGRRDGVLEKKDKGD